MEKVTQTTGAEPPPRSGSRVIGIRANRELVDIREHGLILVREVVTLRVVGVAAASRRERWGVRSACIHAGACYTACRTTSHVCSCTGGEATLPPRSRASRRTVC